MLKFVHIKEVYIPEKRQRKIYKQEDIEKLRSSFIQDINNNARQGILSPPIVTEAPKEGKNYAVMTGGTRLKAMQLYFALDTNLWYHGQKLEPNFIPIIIVQDQGEYACLRAEYDENAARSNLTPAEDLEALAVLAKAKSAMLLEEREKIVQAHKENKDTPVKSLETLLPKVTQKVVVDETVKSLTDTGISDSEKRRKLNTAIKVDAIKTKVAKNTATPEEKTLVTQIDKAKSLRDINKLMTVSETRQKHREAAARAGKETVSERHKVLQGDCLELLQDLKIKSADGCVSDILYGIGANNFGDAAGKMINQVHNYDDSYENWLATIPDMILYLNSVLRADAFLMLACDLSRFQELSKIIAESAGGGWRLWNKPIIQYKRGGGRVPWGNQGFRRSYECWLYAQRGSMTTAAIASDVFDCSSDKEDIYGANKPVSLLTDILQAITPPDVTIIDPMAGTGSLLPAAHHHGCNTILIEQEPDQYGRIIERLNKLK